MIASALVLGAIAVSSFGAAYPMHVAREFFKQAEYVVLLWCAATFVARVPRAPLYFTYGVAAGSAIVATLAISQAIVGGAPSGIWVNGHALPRVAGTLEGPNQLAGYLEAVLPVLWAWPLVAATFVFARRYATFASVSALMLSQSRAGIVVTALAYAALWRLRRAAAVVAAGPVIAGALFGLLVVTGWFVLVAHARLTDLWHMFFFDIPGQQGGGVGTRSQLWPAAWKMFAAHPLTGVGAGNFELLLPTVGLAGVQTQAASLPLQTLAEQGIVGFAALVAFAVVTLRETFRLRAKSPLALAAFLAVAALLMHQLVDDLFFFPKAAELCYLLVGAGSALPVEAQA
jgi:O-antigen ligase